MDLSRQSSDAVERAEELATSHDWGSEGSAPAGEDGPDTEDTTLTLLERLDRRQNRVLKALDQLNGDIERLVTHCQLDRQKSQVA